MTTLRHFLASLLAICAAVNLNAQSSQFDHIKIEKDVPYREINGETLAFDIAKPVTGSGPFPLVVCIHGGGWQKGNKSVPPYQHLIRMLADNGFVAVSVAYRFAPKSRFPAQIQDVKYAIRYLRAKAGEFQIDPDRVIALGHSAGGHLALLAGLGGKALEPPDCPFPTSSEVRAVVNYFGPTDFSKWLIPAATEPQIRKSYGKSSDEVIADFVGTANRSAPEMRAVSPIAYIDPKDPPVITFHGTRDNQVDFEQATILHSSLKKAGVSEELVVIQGGGHGWQGERLEFSNKKLLEFLAAHTRKN